MKKTQLYIISILFCFTFFTPVQSQILGTFEDKSTDQLLLSGHWITETLFKKTPNIYDNPRKDGINTSDKCFGAVNVANADWWGNFYSLNLKTPVTITNENRFLIFQAYRSIQPKSVRIGFNSREGDDAIFEGKLSKDAQWEEIVIDLGKTRMGETLNAIFFVFSCNWDDPRTGWGEAEYYFDNFRLSATPPPLTMAKVKIDPSKTYQTIEGFGASDCWSGNYVGKYWVDDPKNYIAEKLFSQTFDDLGNPKGIGLSMWRVNLGAGTMEQGDDSGIGDVTRRAECFLDANGNFDWTKQSGQQFFMNKAKEYGCESFVAFSNSAPTIYTRNGKGYASIDGNSNLRNDAYGDFANYLTTVIKHFQDNGFNFSYISPVNEPQYDWKGGQEGSPWQNYEIKKLAVELDKSIQDKKLNTQILLTEAGSWEYLYTDKGRSSNQIFDLFNYASSNYIGNLSSVAPIIAGHSYWTFGNNATIINTRQKIKEVADRHRLKVYQTEFSMLDAPPSDAGFPGYETAEYIDIALFTAKIIHCDLAYAGASSWSYWTAMDVERWGHKNRFLLIGLSPEGHAYGDMTKTGDAYTTAGLWALGNYSLFVRPGYQRIDIDGANEMNDLLGSAYLSPDKSQLVAVYVNTSYGEREIETDLSFLEKVPISVSRYVTTSTKNLERDQTLSENNVNAIFTVPQRSITTVVYELEKNNDTSINRILIDGEEFDINDVRYVVACDNSSSVLNMNIEVGEGAQVKPSNTINIDISKPSITEVTFEVIAQNGTSKEYSFEVEKRFNFNSLVSQKWDNTFIINEKSAEIGTFKFINYQWFKNDIAIGYNKPFYSAGRNVSDKLDPNSKYRIELVTADNKKMNTCPGSPILKGKNATVQIYPSLIATNESFTINADLEQELLEAGVIRVYNMLGNVVKDIPMQGQSMHSITLESTGIHLIKIISLDGFEMSYKIIVK